MSNDVRSRTYPTRPYLAVSAAIFRDGRVLIVRRARPPAHGLYTLPGGGVERHFVILPFAARWISGEVALNEELAEAQWRDPSALSDLTTTDGLALIVSAAWERITAAR